MLVAKDLTKFYGDFLALNSLNLSIKDGEIYCLLGANGAGKSTTINLFLNFIKPSSGEVYIKDINANKNASQVKKLIAYIPENLMLYPHLTGLENLSFFCGLSGKKPAKSQLVDLLKEAGLQEAFIDKRVSTYSKGMRQKVGIALATAKEAKVLLLDEPTSGLDPKSSNEFSELLLKMKAKGVATLMATHDLFRAKDTGTHIGIMKGGNLLESFPSGQVSFHDLESLYLKHMHN